MKKRLLGTELEVSEIGLGCMTLGKSQNQSENEAMAQIIQEAYHLGVTYFDTAEVYGNEAFVGSAIKSFRKDIVLASKCGIKVIDGKQVVDGRPEELRKSLEQSLEKLQTDYLDLYYLHRIDPNTPIELIAETMKEFQKEGKIRYWGLSEPGAQTIRKAHKVFPLAAIQSEYSMMFREPETEIIPTLEELNIGFVPFSPLAKGFLTGAETGSFTGAMQVNTRFTGDYLTHNLELRELVLAFAEDKKVTPAQLSLAWVLAQKDFIVPIPGTTKMERMKENVGATEITFTADELARLNEVLNNFEVAGERYTPGSDMAKRVGL